MAEDRDLKRAIAESLADNDEQQFLSDLDQAKKASLNEGGHYDDCNPHSNKRQCRKFYGDEKDGLVMESMPSSTSPPNCLDLALVSRNSIKPRMIIVNFNWKGRICLLTF